MTHLPETSARLLAAGFNPQPIEEAAARCFNAVGRDENGKLVRGALYSSDAVTQRFWDAFVLAHKALRGGGEMKEAA